MPIFKAPNNDTFRANSADGLPNGCVEISEEELAQITLSRQVTETVVPSKVTMRQARLVLLNEGKLQAVNNAISSMQGLAGDAARIEWDYSNEVHRNQPLTIQLAQLIGMTPQEMDAMFVKADKL